MTSVRLREARPEDAEALHRLYHAAYARAEDPHRPAGTALEDSVDDVRGSIEEGDVLVAEDESGALVGSVMVRSVANIRRLAVAPDRKRAGLATEILRAAEEHARKRGLRWAMLDTIPTHPWLPSFYRKQGFVERCLERFPNGIDWVQFRKRL